MTREAVIVLRILLNGDDTVYAESAEGKREKVFTGGYLNRKTSLYPALLKALDELESFDPFTDPAGEWMFGTGVLKEGLFDLRHISDERLLAVAMTLYGRLLPLYPVWNEAVTPASSAATSSAAITPFSMETSTDAETNPEADDVGIPDTREPRVAELMKLLVDRFGYDPDTADTPLQDIAEEMYRREQEMAEKEE